MQNQISHSKTKQEQAAIDRDTSSGYNLLLKASRIKRRAHFVTKELNKILYTFEMTSFAFASRKTNSHTQFVSAWKEPFSV